MIPPSGFVVLLSSRLRARIDRGPARGRPAPGAARARHETTDEDGEDRVLCGTNIGHGAFTVAEKTSRCEVTDGCPD
jgi:hypothetical protein